MSTVVASFDSYPPNGIGWEEHWLRALPMIGGILDDIGRPCLLVSSTALIGVLAMIQQIHYVPPKGTMPRMIGYVLGMELWVDFASPNDELHFVTAFGEQPLGRLVVQNLVEPKRSLLERIARAAI